jgi:predicted acylesterase/phospholipase RssA
LSLALAFEGCSCRAAFHVGVARRLAALGVPVAGASGASSGSIVAAAVSSGRVAELWPAWEGLLGTDPWQPAQLWRGHWPGRMSHILREALDGWLGGLRLAELALPVAIVVTQVGPLGRHRRVLGRGDDLLVSTAIRASSFIPGPYSRMVPIEGRLTFDGAWQQRVPVDEARPLGDGRVLAVVTRFPGVLLGGLRGNRRHEAQSDTRLLAPLAPLPLEGFDFDAERTLACVLAGEHATDAFVRDQEPWLRG